MRRGVKGVDCGRRWVGGGRDKAELPCWGYGGSAGHDRKCGNRGGHLEDSSRTHSKPTSITAPCAWYFYYAEWWRGQTNSSTVDQSLWNKNIKPCANINAPPTPTQILLPLSTKTAIETNLTESPSLLCISAASQTFFLPISQTTALFESCKTLKHVHLPSSISCKWAQMWCHYSCRPKQIILFFDSQKQPARDELGDTRAPGHWLIIKRRSQSVLTQITLLPTAAVTHSFQRNTKLPFTEKINHYSDGRPGPLSLPADLGKGGATFKSLIVLSRPCLDSASLNHRHTYLVDADQCFVGLQKVWARCWKFSCCHVQERKRFFGVTRKAKLQQMSN